MGYSAGAIPYIRGFNASASLKRVVLYADL